MTAREAILKFLGVIDADTTLLIIPGTGDRTGAALMRWMAFVVELFAQARRVVVDYPATTWPLFGDKKYDVSMGDAAVAVHDYLLKGTGKIVILAYSQGADAVWPVVRDFVASHPGRADDIYVVLCGHPQHPGGIKDVMRRRHRIVSWVFARWFSAIMDGSWRLSAETQVLSVSIRGDSITEFTAFWPNPFRGFVRFVAGYLMIHGELGQQGAPQLADLSVARETHVPGTRTTYLLLDALDPVEQLKCWLARAWLQKKRISERTPVR